MISNFEFAENVVGIIIDTDIGEELIREAQCKIDEKLKGHEKINLFFEIRRGNKMTLKAFINQMGFNVSHNNRFNKIAVVTDINWLQNSLTIKDLLVAAEIKTFCPGDRMNALGWIAL